MRSRSAKLAGAALLTPVLAIAALALNVTPSFAHTPHDQISGVAVSPAFATDHTVFTISDSRPMRSTDSGRNWVEMMRGLSGQNFQHFGISPADPQIIYLSALNTFNLSEQRSGPGIFRSNDQGLTWNPTNTPMALSNATVLAVSPTSPDVVLAVQGLFGGLFRTTNGGATWTQVRGIDSVTTVAFVPSTPGRVVIGDRTGTLRVSSDDGVTFTPSGSSPQQRPITSLAVATKAEGSTVFAGTGFGAVLRSDDAGSSWTTLRASIPDQQQVNSLALAADYATSHTLWASAFHHGVYRSTNAGKTWKPVFKGLTLDDQANSLKLGQFGDLAVSPGAARAQRLFVGGYDGLFTSSNGSAWHELQTLSDYVTGLAVSPNYAKDGTVEVNSYVKGVYLSRNRGRSFVARNRGLGEALGPGNKLLPIHRMHDVEFSPGYATDHTIFTATWDLFVRSTNGGRKWTGVVVSPPPPSSALRQFVIAVSPQLPTDGTIYLGTRQGNVYRSSKGGVAKSWSEVANLHHRVRSIVISPEFDTDRTLFAGTEAGTFASRDAGVTWTPTGPAGIALLAISPGYASDGTVFAGTERGLFVTRDRGATWAELSTAPRSVTSKVTAIAVSPDFQHDGTVLVSIGGTGLFRSTDAGRDFTAVGSSLLKRGLVITDFENPTSEPIQFSPAFATDRTVFAYAQHSVVRSTDGGDTWQVLKIPPASALSADHHAHTGSSG